MRLFLEYIPAHVATSKLRKRLEYLTHYYNEDRWGETDTDFPTILFVSETGLGEAGVRRLISREKYHSDTEIVYYATTQNALLSSTATNKSIWSNADDTDDRLSLLEL